MLKLGWVTTYRQSSITLTSAHRTRLSIKKKKKKKKKEKKRKKKRKEKKKTKSSDMYPHPRYSMNRLHAKRNGMREICRLVSWRTSNNEVFVYVGSDLSNNSQGTLCPREVNLRLSLSPCIHKSSPFGGGGGGGVGGGRGGRGGGGRGGGVIVHRETKRERSPHPTPSPTLLSFHSYLFPQPTRQFYFKNNKFLVPGKKDIF
jgi:hypothetical protein